MTHFGAGLALCGDLTRGATWKAGRAARTDARARGGGGRIDVCRWNVAALPLRACCVDVLVTDFPWGSRQKAGPGLLLDALVEFGRVLALGGRAVMLLTRVAAARVPYLAPASLRLETLLNVVVGGCPTAVVTLRKVAAASVTDDGEPTDGGGGGGDGGGSGGGGHGGGGCGHGAVSSNVCCAVRVSEALSKLRLSELLQQVWPRHYSLYTTHYTLLTTHYSLLTTHYSLLTTHCSLQVWPRHVPSQSAAKRAVRHGRVCVVAAPRANLFWRGTVAQGERLVLRPIAAQRMQPVAEAVALADELRLANPNPNPDPDPSP